MSQISPRFGHTPAPQVQSRVQFGALSENLSSQIKGIKSNESVEDLIDLYQTVKAEDKQTQDADDKATLGAASKKILFKIGELFRSEVDKPVTVHESETEINPHTGQKEVKESSYQVDKSVIRYTPSEAMAMLQKLEATAQLDADLGDTLRQKAVGDNQQTVVKNIQQPYRELLDRAEGEGPSPLNKALILLESNEQITTALKDAQDYSTVRDQRALWTTALSSVQADTQEALDAAIGKLSSNEALSLLKEVGEQGYTLSKSQKFDLALQSGVSGEQLRDLLDQTGIKTDKIISLPE